MRGGLRTGLPKGIAVRDQPPALSRPRVPLESSQKYHCAAPTGGGGYGPGPVPISVLLRTPSPCPKGSALGRPPEKAATLPPARSTRPALLSGAAAGSQAGEGLQGLRDPRRDSHLGAPNRLQETEAAKRPKESF